MKSYLKFLALICAVTLSAVMLSACADNTPPPPPPPAPEPVHPNSQAELKPLRRVNNGPAQWTLKMLTSTSTPGIWPFDQARNTATFTVRQIMDGSRPILRVRHDADDHGWQFLTGEILKMENAMLVALHEVVSKDASLYELADLPPGWHATRNIIHEPWIRALNPPEDDE